MGHSTIAGVLALIASFAVYDVRADTPPVVGPGPSSATVSTGTPAQKRVLPVHIARVTDVHGEEVAVASYAPGSPVAFAQPDQLPNRILIKRHVLQGLPTPPNETIWQIAPRQTRILNQHGRFGAGTMLPGVAFEVPQLPRGIYDAWYVDGQPTSPVRSVAAPVKSADPRATQSITFEIKPRLRVPEAVVHGAVGTDVEVAIGFVGSTTVPPTTVGGRQSYDHIPISLTGLGGFAQLAPGQTTQGVTGVDGLAHFKVRLSAVGQADLNAVSPGYDPTFLRIIAFDASQLVGGRLPLRTDLLQPGDALLFLRNGFISDSIAEVEPDQIGRNPNGRPPAQLTHGLGAYSHAAIYIGKNVQGVPEVIEMLEGLWDGWTRRPLETSIKDDSLLVDVYRRQGLTATQRQQLVANAISYHAEHALFGYHLPYANGQILVLLKAYAGGLDTSVQLLADYEDLFDEGKDRMICSELVAWAYYDAGFRLTVRPWPAMSGHGVLTTGDRWMDYTTPNMLAQSPDLQFQFMLWPMI